MAETQDTAKKTAESDIEVETSIPVPRSDDGATECSEVSADATKHVHTHDPRQVIEDLRNHLAPHDRCVVFLFGAGTPSAINIAPHPPRGEKYELRLLPEYTYIDRTGKSPPNGEQQLDSVLLGSRGKYRCKGKRADRTQRTGEDEGDAGAGG